MKNIYLLPTDKPSRLAYDFNNLILNSRLISPILYKTQNIYITSNEEIKEGDWFYNTISLKSKPFKACENGDGYVNCNRYSHYRIDCKKIILTTDPDLIKDGVQAIGDDFLEWFVNNPNYEEIDWNYKSNEFIQKEIGSWGHDEGLLESEYREYVKKYGAYKIIFPKEENKFEDSIENSVNIMSIANSMFGKKEEPKQEIIASEEDAKIFVDAIKNPPDPNKNLKRSFEKQLNQALERGITITHVGKQETLEEAAERLMPKTVVSEQGKAIWRLAFEESDKWQAERMYSEEDLINFGWLCREKSLTNVDLLVEQFKKK